MSKIAKIALLISLLFLTTQTAASHSITGQPFPTYSSNSPIPPTIPVTTTGVSGATVMADNNNRHAVSHTTAPPGLNATLQSPTLTLTATHYNGGFVELEWASASETAIAAYTIQRTDLQTDQTVTVIDNIPAHNSGKPIGAHYRAIDDTTEPNHAYRYLIGVISTQSPDPAYELLGIVLTGPPLYLPTMLGS